jgi:hypothetical protein
VQRWKGGKERDLWRVYGDERDWKIFILCDLRSLTVEEVEVGFVTRSGQAGAGSFTVKRRIEVQVVVEEGSVWGGSEQRRKALPSTQPASNSDLNHNPLSALAALSISALSQAQIQQESHHPPLLIS